MVSHQSKAQKDTVGRVMHEYKHGELRSSSTGKKVKNPRQAVAIALSEAGASNEQSPRQNRHSFARSKRKEARGETAQAETEGRQGRRNTRADLYQEARRRDIPGRSRMNKAQLQRALGR